MYRLLTLPSLFQGGVSEKLNQIFCHQTFRLSPN